MSVQNNWFESWFDSKYYHILYRDRDYSEAEKFIKKLGKYLKLDKNDKVLDLACGKGRHSLSLSAFGADVLGLDLSKQSIAQAAQASTENLNFQVHDMRDALPSKGFTVIVNLFTSFGYFDDDDENLRSIQNMADGLKKGGSLVIDYMNTPKVVGELIENEIKTVDDIVFHISRTVKDGWIVKNIQFKAEGELFEFQERVRALQLDDFKRYFEKTGLVLQSVFGDYDLNAYDIKSSPRMIFKLSK